MPSFLLSVNSPWITYNTFVDILFQACVKNLAPANQWINLRNHSIFYLRVVPHWSRCFLKVGRKHLLSLISSPIYLYHVNKQILTRIINFVFWYILLCGWINKVNLTRWFDTYHVANHVDNGHLTNKTKNILHVMKLELCQEIDNKKITKFWQQHCYSSYNTVYNPESDGMWTTKITNESLNCNK